MSRPLYFKITNENENHQGFQYKTGMNVLEGSFNDDEKASCVPGGLYFTTVEHLHHFYHYGVWLRVVELPENDSTFKMVKDPDTRMDKWRANKLILGDRFRLWDLVTVAKFGLRHTEKFFGFLMSVGDYAAAKQWVLSTQNFTYDESSMDNASAARQLDLLHAWKSSGRKPLYSERAMNHASHHGHIDVLNWWKHSGLPLKYTSDALWYPYQGLGSVYGDATVRQTLHWWRDSGLELKFPTNCDKAIRFWFLKESTFFQVLGSIASSVVVGIVLGEGIASILTKKK
jgi:hypothetical protein